MSPPTTSKLLYFTVVVLGLATSLGDASRLFNVSNVHNGSINATNFFKSPAGVLTVPLRRVDRQGVTTPSIAKRFFKTDILGVFGAAYMAELTIGTGREEQIVDVLIDTGSFELWVNPDCSASNVPEFCDAFGHYDPALSPSAESLNGDFEIEYGSGNTSGTYYKDDIYISGARVKAQQFGVANRSDLVWFGIMGLGHGLGNGFINYPLLIDSLAAQEFTNSKLFSLDLGSQIDPGAAVTGQIVFGGVDTNKYSGTLGKVPTDPSDPHYKVNLNSLSHRAPNKASTRLLDSNLPLPVVLDSGTTLSLLPESLVSELAAQFPGATSDGKGGYKVPCSLQDDEGDMGSVDFEFLSPRSRGSVTISVSYRDFIWKSGSDCFLGAVHTDDIDVWILGDTFLRGAYVSFDQTNNALYMSKYRTCGTGPNLVPVPAGPDAAARIQGSCPPAPIVVGPRPPPATLPDDTVSSTAVASAAPTLGGPLNPPESDQADPDVARISGATGADASAEEDPTSTTTTTTTPRVTLKSTLTRAVAYTVISCADSGPGCAQLGRVATSFETTVTTFCPGHDNEDDEGRPSASAAMTGIIALKMGMITESSAPVASMLMLTNTTASLQKDQGQEQQVQGTVTLTQVQQEEGQQQQQQQQEKQSSAEEEGRILTRTVITSRCSTNTYAVSACDLGSSACTLDATTTSVVTIVETIIQLVKPTPATLASTSASDIVSYHIPRPPPSPPRITPGAALSFGPAYNGSNNMGVAGFGGVKQSVVCATCRGVAVAPGANVNTNSSSISISKVKGIGPAPTRTGTPTSTSEAGANTGKPLSSDAAPVNEGLTDRVHLVLAFAAVFGIMVLIQGPCDAINFSSRDGGW